MLVLLIDRSEALIWKGNSVCPSSMFLIQQCKWLAAIFLLFKKKWFSPFPPIVSLNVCKYAKTISWQLEVFKKNKSSLLSIWPNRWSPFMLDAHFLCRCGSFGNTFQLCWRFWIKMVQWIICFAICPCFTNHIITILITNIIHSSYCATVVSIIEIIRGTDVCF